MGWNFDVFWDLPWGGPGSENKVRLGLKAASWSGTSCSVVFNWLALVTFSVHFMAVWGLTNDDCVSEGKSHLMRWWLYDTK